MKPNPTPSLALSVLVDGLLEWAEGDYGVEAAVELLIDHGTWLHRRDFRSDAVWVSDILPDRPRWIGIDWSRAAALASTSTASDCERSVLMLAVSLAGEPIPKSLRDLLVDLDEDDSNLVINAVTHATGLAPDDNWGLCGE